MYLLELRQLHRMGIVASWADYEALPVAVLEDARLLLEGEALGQKMEDRRGNR
jgi:hypothetical protein